MLIERSKEVAALIEHSDKVIECACGTGMPGISLVVPLAKVLSVSTDTLFGLQDEKMDDGLYIVLRRQIEKVEEESENKAEAALAACQFMLKKVYEVISWRLEYYGTF